MGQDLREASKRGWTSSTDTQTTTDLQIGALIRIADEIETMALRYQELIENREHWRKEFFRIANQNVILRHQIAGLKGVLTRLRKRL